MCNAEQSMEMARTETGKRWGELPTKAYTTRSKQSAQRSSGSFYRCSDTGTIFRRISKCARLMRRNHARCVYMDNDDDSFRSWVNANMLESCLSSARFDQGRVSRPWPLPWQRHMAVSY